MADTELLTFYDDSGRPIGTKTRAQVHKDGAWHALVFVLSVRAENEARRVLLQLRRGRNDPYGGQIDVSAAGHVASTESTREAAIREYLEEVGVMLDSSDLVWLGVRNLIYASGVCRRAIQNFYLCLRPFRLEETKFNSEVGGFFEVELEDFIEYVDAKRSRLPARARMGDGDGEIKSMDLTRAAMAAYPPLIIDNFRRLLVSTKAYLESGVIDPTFWE
jgi:8-oxo-dGTP pyrophosphatase MutT (NUDIX family)